jgi:hypothetical protein
VDSLWISGEENFTGGVKKTSPGVVKKTSPRILLIRTHLKNPSGFCHSSVENAFAVVRGLADGRSVVSAE